MNPQIFIRRAASFSLSLCSYLFVTVFLLRLFVLARFSASDLLLPVSGDMHFYNEWAQRILGGQLTDHRAFYGLPLYPYLLALLYRAFGYNPFIPGFLQALLEGGTAVLIYKLAVEIFGHAQPPGDESSSPQGPLRFFLRRRGECIGLLTALGWAFFLPAQAYAVVLMPAAWLVFVFWFVVWQIVRRPLLPRPGTLLLLGTLIGFTAMGMATILFLIPLLLAALLWKWKILPDQRRYWLSKPMAAVALVLGGIGIGTSPCWIHNYFIAKDPVILSAHSGVNFWIGNNPLATGYPRFPPGLHAGQAAMLQDSITAAEKAAGHPLKRSEVSAYWSKKANSYIKGNFGSWLKLVFTKVSNFWNAFQYDDLSIITILSEQGVILPGVQFGLIAALAIPGLILAAISFPLSRWIVAAILLHMMALLPVFVTERYRLIVAPGLLLFAAFGIFEFWQTCLSAKYARAFLYLLVLALGTLFVSIPQQNPALWALDPYNSGWQALQSKNYRLARKKLQLAYAYVPGNAETNFALGNLSLEEGDKTAAKARYRVTLELDPTHEGAWNNLGILALEEKRWGMAVTFFSKALEQAPENAKTRYLLATALFDAGDSERALIEIDKALLLNSAQREFVALKAKIVRKAAPRLSP